MTIERTLELMEDVTNNIIKTKAKLHPLRSKLWKGEKKVTRLESRYKQLKNRLITNTEVLNWKNI